MQWVHKKVVGLDKGRIYDVIPLNWGINNYDIYNINGLIETLILYTYIIIFI
jgi:hypothetical protein